LTVYYIAQYDEEVKILFQVFYMSKDSVLKLMREATGESIRVLAKEAKVNSHSLILDYEKEKDCYKRMLRYWLYVKEKTGMSNKLFVKAMESYSGHKKVKK